jgi:predicted phage terminase large subunit-like protein
MHEEFFDILPKAITNGVPDNIVRAAPRGNAKSTITSFALIIWAAVYQHKHYIIVVSDTVDQAQDFLSNIRTEIEDNELLRNDFGELVGNVWTLTDIILSNDVRIQALGATKKIRGRRYKQYRPDLIVCDDLENDENIASPDQRKKMENWYKKALSKAGDERTDKIIIGTIMHSDSLLSKILSNPIYDAKIYKSIIKWSNSKLWDDWTRLVTTLEDSDRLQTARAFFDEHQEEMLAGTQVLWQAKEDYYNLMLQYVADGPAAFSSEKQNEPLAEEDRKFLPEWIRYYDDEEIEGQQLFIVGFVDPSMGKLGGDYSAIITLGVNSNDIVYVLDADILKRHPDIIAIDVINKHQMYEYIRFGVEEVQFQEFFKDTLKTKANEMEVSIPIVGVRQHKDKILRIESLQPDIKNGRIRFRRDQKTLISQIIDFPMATHDDGPDALEGAISLISRRSAVADYYKEQMHERKQPESTNVVSIKKQRFSGLVNAIQNTG